MSDETGDQRLRQELVEQARMSVDYWRERNALRTELAELKAREYVLQPALKAALNNSHDEIERLRAELATYRFNLGAKHDELNRALVARDEARTELAELKGPALAGDALRDKITETVTRVMQGAGHAEPLLPPPAAAEEIVAAVMPIVGRAALAARSAFPVLTERGRSLYTYSADTETWHSTEDADPAERELRVTPTLGGTIHRGVCSRCLWTMHSGNRGNLEYAFDRHECALYPDTENDNTESAHALRFMETRPEDNMGWANCACGQSLDPGREVTESDAREYYTRHKRVLHNAAYGAPDTEKESDQ